MGFNFSNIITHTFCVCYRDQWIFKSSCSQELEVWIPNIYVNDREIEYLTKTGPINSECWFPNMTIYGIITTTWKHFRIRRFNCSNVFQNSTSPTLLKFLPRQPKFSWKVVAKNRWLAKLQNSQKLFQHLWFILIVFTGWIQKLHNFRYNKLGSFFLQTKVRFHHRKLPFKFSVIYRAAAGERELNYCNFWG